MTTRNVRNRNSNRSTTNNVSNEQTTTTTEKMSNVTGDEQNILESDAGHVPLLQHVPIRSRSMPNLSIDFADSKSFWLYYIFIIIVVRLSMYFFQRTLGPYNFLWPGWTLVNIAHALITFYLMHWKRGTVDPFDGGVSDRNTFWELLDNGKQWTIARKFYTIVPIIIFLFSCYETEWKKRYFVSNVISLGICLIPKNPAMMGVRLFGVNS